VSIAHRPFALSNLYTAIVRHAGVTYTVEAEADRSDAKLTGLYVAPVPPFDSIPPVLDVAGKALYVAAVRAYTAGDSQKHRLLIGVSGSLGAYALGLRRAMEGGQAA
jgi:hypothetical protein